MKKLMSQADYARRIGITRQSLGDLVRRGVITLVDGKVDPDYADHQRALNMNPATSKSLQSDGVREALDERPTVTNMSEYQIERAARERLERMSAQLDYDVKTGALIERAGVQRAIADASRALGDQLMSLSRRLAAELASCSDMQAIERRIEAEHRAALNQFADGLLDRLGKGLQAHG